MFADWSIVIVNVQTQSHQGTMAWHKGEKNHFSREWRLDPIEGESLKWMENSDGTWVFTETILNWNQTLSVARSCSIRNEEVNNLRSFTDFHSGWTICIWMVRIAVYRSPCARTVRIGTWNVPIHATYLCSFILGWVTRIHVGSFHWIRLFGSPHTEI